ncbi:MAG: Acyl carrier protein [Candidatus Dichloromethanomonas elyunquensis]|nr:MAG: Acyl carrier protein [Candidatus Dichloromethanomonas elyunquensis]
MTLKKIREIIAEQVGMEEEKITLDSDFKEDLGIDSLDIFEIIMEIEEVYAIEIPTEDLEGMGKVADLVRYLDSRVS